MRRRDKINFLIVGQTLLLLAVALGILFYFSHRALKQEAVGDAENMLESTVLNIDNILLSVEQSAGNVYYDLLEHLDDPDRMFTYCRELVLSNPNIVGCAIAFKPGYYPGKDLFMAYVHRRGFDTDVTSDLVTTDMFTNRPYTEQIWYRAPVDDGYVGWTDPLKGDDTENEPLVNFCMPLPDKSGQRVGVLAVDVSISQLSKIVLAVKPSERGYCVLMSKSGSLIVHPDVDKLQSANILRRLIGDVDPRVKDAIESMMAGETGMKEYQMNGETWTIFYKPFQRTELKERSNGQLDWSVGIVCPEADIHGAHNKLLLVVLCITFVGLILFVLLCRWFIRRELKPLRLLSDSAQRVADGQINENVPQTHWNDEIANLQNQFRVMLSRQKEREAALADEAAQLHQDADQLRAAYGRVQENDRMKTSFLNYITNQMALPAESIDQSVTTLCNNYRSLSKDEICKQVEVIEHKSETLVELLNHMAHFTKSETRKEADDE